MSSENDFLKYAKSKIEELFPLGNTWGVFAVERYCSGNAIECAIPLAFLFGEHKTEKLEYLNNSSFNLEEQLNFALNKIKELFPKHNNEILIWRCEPMTDERGGLYFRLASMPRDAEILIFRDDFFKTKESFNEYIESIKNRQKVA